MSEQRNLILAVALSAAVLFGWQYFIGVPQLQQAQQNQTQQSQTEAAGTKAASPAKPAAPKTPPSLPRAAALAQSPRATIMTPTIDGSIDLTGGRFDDLKLRLYHETPNPKSPEINLLSPLTAAHPYFAEFGWVPGAGAAVQAPGPETPWTVQSGGTLSPGHDLVLTYTDPQGLVFTRHISVDDQYLFTITDQVRNTGTTPVVLYPYARVSRQKLPEARRYWVVHEGYVGVMDGTLKDPSYKDLGDKDETRTYQSTGGWLGITDKYWMAALIPPQNQPYTGTYKAFDANGTKVYQSDYLLKPRTIAPGASDQVTHRLFAGAKVVGIIQNYGTKLGITRFDLAIDWGWFRILTKPIFQALEIIYRFVGNFGVAILIFTVFVKLLFFPLANMSYRSMSKMKKLQPEMERLRERYKEDKVQQQQAVMELYKHEKVNPLAGCLPMLIQIPVFFSLYKVLFTSIEMRHAPFVGWIHDLSAPDPTSLFNLFGLLPFMPPTFLMIGVFPLIMGATMWLQTNLNPPPADPTQARIFSFMPLIFMFMMANFPVGLVIYWSWNNLLSIAQQVFIMKRTGTPVDLFDRLRGMGRRLRRGEAFEKPAGPPD